MGRSREQQREYMRAYRARKRAEKAAEAAASTPPADAAGATPPPPPKPEARHLPALERMLTESGLDGTPEEAPLVALLRDLAADLDVEPNARTRQQYLTALRDARRVLAAAPGVPGAGGRPDADEPDPEPEVGPEAPEAEGMADFESFRRAKGGAAAG